MKSYVYTFTKSTPRNGHAISEVTIYRIIRGSPRFVTHMTETFVSEFQLVMQALEATKELPAKAYRKHDNGSAIYGYPDGLREAGIANINRV